MVKTPQQIEGIRRACRICRRILDRLGQMVRPGISTEELARAGEQMLAEEKVVSAFRGYRGYPSAFCLSVNEEVVHGIPGPGKVLASGDIVGIDVGVICDGFYGDCADTFCAGEVSAVHARLIEAARGALAAGISQAVAGNRVGDISAAVQSFVEAAGFSVVRQFAGHGVGCELHEPPEIPNFGKKGTGPVLRENMTIAIEPMVNEGSRKVRILEDGWTAVTEDGRYSAHSEHTVLVGRTAAEVLTQAEYG